MHQFIQQTVDILVLVMAGILALFTLGLAAVHFVTNAEQKSIQRIRRQLLRLVNVQAHIEYIRGRIYSLLDPEGEVVSLREIRGIRSRRGVQVLEMVAREVSGAQAETLSLAVRDEWYSAYLTKKLASRDQDTAILAEKLIAELRAPGYTELIERNLRRWSGNADAQQIGLLALFMRGQEEVLVRLFSDPDFRLILSFRTLQELFHCYGGDHEALYRALLAGCRDQYVRRACIRGVGLDGCADLCGELLPYLESENLNLRLEAVRTLGRLEYAPAADAVRAFTRHASWEERSAAADALVRMDPEGCYDDLFRCLCDREWWVRFHAAEALVSLPCREKLLADAGSCGDRFAFEMVRFMVERETILKGGDAA